MPGALDTTCASPCGNITTSPANSCTDGPPGIAGPAAALRRRAWYSITCSTPRISSGASSFAGGASAAQSLLPLTLKKTAPRRRTPRSTSDSVSWLISRLRRSLDQAARTIDQAAGTGTDNNGRASKRRRRRVKRRTDEAEEWLTRRDRIAAALLHRVHFRSITCIH